MIDDDEKMLTMVKPIDDAFARFQLGLYFEEDVVDVAMSLPQDVRDLLLGYLYMSSKKNTGHSRFVSMVEIELIKSNTRTALAADFEYTNSDITEFLNRESKTFLSGPIQLEFFETHNKKAEVSVEEMTIESPSLLKRALEEHIPYGLAKEISRDANASLAIISAAKQMKAFNLDIYGKFVDSLKTYMTLGDSSSLNDRLTLFWNHWFDSLQKTMAHQDGISIAVNDQTEREMSSHTIEVWLDNLSDVLSKTRIADVHLIHELLLHLSHAYYTNRLLLSESVIKTNNSLSNLLTMVDQIKNDIDLAEEIEGIKGLAMLSIAANDNITEGMIKDLFHGTKDFYNLHFIKLLSVVHGSSISFLKRIRLQADAALTAGMALLISEDFEIARNKTDKREIAISLLEGAIHSTHSSEAEVARYRDAVAYLLSDSQTKKPKKDKWVIPKGLTTSLTNIFLSPVAEEVSEEVCETVQSYS